MGHTTRAREEKSSDPEFDLRRVRGRHEGPNASQIGAAGDAMEDPWAALPRHRHFRQWVSRVIGILAIAGSLYGIAKVGAHAEARAAIVDWLTLGHGKQARSAHDSLRRWAARALGPDSAKIEATPPNRP
jgi:hypothetical protein